MSDKNRNLFRITRLILLKLPAVFRFFGRFRKQAPRLLIIKTDAIGDYILFRNFLAIVRKSEKFRHHQVTLLGNELWADLAKKYDGSFVNEFIFINPDELYWQPLQVLRLGWALYKRNFSTVFQPAFTRLLINDGLAALTAAREIVGFESDNEGILPRYKAKTDRFYTNRLILPKDLNFEFDRSRFFFETLLGKKIDISEPALPVTNIERNGVVIFPGAGVSGRCWEPDKFAALIRLILDNTDHLVTIGGGNCDTGIAARLMEKLDTSRVVDRTGQTSLPDLIELIGSSALVIANETSAIHIGAAAGTPSVCILGGGHFGRFAPYPQTMQTAPVCSFEKMDCFNCNWHCIYKTAQNEPFPCISAIGAESVWQAAQPYL